MLKTTIAFLITVVCFIAIMKAHNRHTIKNSPRYKEVERFDRIATTLLNSNQQK